MDNTGLTILFSVAATLVSVIGILVSIQIGSLALFLSQEANTTSRLLQFETTFFNLLKAQSDIVADMDIVSKKKPLLTLAKGRDCFNKFYRMFKTRIRLYKRDMLINLNPMNTATKQDIEEVLVSFEEILVVYMGFYKKHQGDLGHYFRNLYHVIRLVEDTPFILDKKKYIRIVRAQLSSYELVMLFYNALSENGQEEFKPLIERYQLLKNMDLSLLIDVAHSNKYKEGAYKKQKA